VQSEICKDAKGGTYHFGCHQEYFEQVMSYPPDEAEDLPPDQRKAERTRADPEGIFASATPGDKA